MAFRVLSAAAMVLAAATAAQAQDGFTLSYGANLTSNYIDRGTTQSDDKPAAQGYVEAAYGLFYGGVWTSTVDFGDGDDDALEINLSAGVRPTIGDLSLDLSYTRYVYDDSGDCCGEVVVLATYPFSDVIEGVGAAYWDPEAETKWVELGSSVYIAEVWAVGAIVGTDFGSLDEGEDDKVAWNAGVTRGIGDYVTADLRFHDSNYDPGRLVFSLAADF